MSKQTEIKYDKNYFMKCFQILSNNQHSYTAWSDIIEVFALSIINPLTKQAYQNDPELKKIWDGRENRYLKIINNYSKEKQELFPQMFACLVNEFENNPEQDLLGSIYMNLGISNNNSGQFFTPYDLCRCFHEINANGYAETIDKVVADYFYKCGYKIIDWSEPQYADKNKIGYRICE